MGNVFPGSRSRLFLIAHGESAHVMNTPRLAIGLYVYNGERHIVAAIDSLLSQTMGDFVLDISDNASTDLTEKICRSYAAADSRVRYIRHDQNRGPTWNFNFVEHASPETELYKWCAHDDVYDPTYLEKCVAELDRRPEVVACHSRVRYINDNGDELMRSFRQMDFTDDRPWVRFNQVLLRPHDHSHGVRSDAPLGSCPDSSLSVRIQRGRYFALRTRPPWTVRRGSRASVCKSHAPDEIDGRNLTWEDTPSVGRTVRGIEKVRHVAHLGFAPAKHLVGPSRPSGEGALLRRSGGVGPGRMGGSGFGSGDRWHS